MLPDDLHYKIALSLFPKVGSKIAKNLVAYTGSPEAVFKEKYANLIKIPGVGSIIAGFINQSKAPALKRAKEEIEFIEKNNIRPYFYLDEDYPFLLKQAEDAPIMFYVKGKIDFRNRKILSIVGTRKATAYGKELCEKLIADLSVHGHNPIIVSGLAYGIDICAHKAALKNGLETVAVFGHGHDRVYPAAHRETARKIQNQGALLTEFMHGSSFDRQNFLKRNRIIAGLAQATLVVESAAKGGSLVTADIANSYNREVFAFPGRVGDASSAGCNALIKKHKAYMIESADDIEYILNWTSNEIKPKQQQLFIELSVDEKRIVRAIQTEGKSMIDQICKQAQLPPAKVSALLLELEFKGAVRNLPGKLFEMATEIHLD